MPERNMPYYPVAMVCMEPLSISAPLPEGYAFEFFKPGMEDAWCQIQCSMGVFPDIGEARKTFEEEFSQRQELLGRRMVFVCDRRRRAVATAALWPEKGMERLHWLCVVPGMLRRGLVSALTERIVEIYRAEGESCGMFLLTHTRNYRAINIYRKFGFVPDTSGTLLPESQSREEFDAAWKLIRDKLTDYERRRRRTVSPDSIFDTAGFMRSSAGFDKSSMCKIFEMDSPRQSGFEPHYHDYSQIWYITQGSCVHQVEGQRYTMSVGDAFYIPPKVIHSTTLGEDSSIICCEFDMESLLHHNVEPYDKIREITQNISFTMLFQSDFYRIQPKLTFSRSGQRQVERLMTSMLEEYQRGADFFEDFLQLQILQLLLIFAREYGSTGEGGEANQVFDKYRGMVELAVKYIDENYDQPLTLEGMCRISMVSKTYFCYIFKLLTGKTFVEYLMEKRIEQSMTLLRETDLSIIEIGQNVGFHEPTHFSRTFKKLRGISPREYRTTAKKNIS